MSLDEEYLDISFLPENGFKRRRCVRCGKYFWSVEDREICGDPPCDTYKFIGKSPFSKQYELDEMREKFLRFFEDRGHRRISRYPVVARWREDIYLTIASIADFQPFVTAGIAPPPANPLAISQPCIRLDDLDSVGKTGRHLTLFEMMAHHAFNYPEKKIYWKNETVAYCTEFLEELGVKKEGIVYKEEPWAGGGNAGPCLEAIVDGLEIATLVFMNLEVSPDGDIEIKGERYRRMMNYIVDTGYGLERFVWMSKGSATVYNAIFGGIVDKLLKEAGIKAEKEIVAEFSRQAAVHGLTNKLYEIVAKKFEIIPEDVKSLIDPLSKVYSLADHTRCILFMLGDGLVPSNAGAGYLARLMIRRSFRILEELGISFDLFKILEMYPYREFDVPMETIQEILELELARYRATLSKGLKLVERAIERNKIVRKEDIVNFYDSHGIPPELVLKIAEEKGTKVESVEIYSEIAKRHSKAEGKEIGEIKIKKSYPKTRKLYYDDPRLFEFEAKVLGVEDSYVIFDSTAFYPESGGQESDAGHLILNGEIIRVLDVREVDGVVLHRVEDASKIKPNLIVKAQIDKERRFRHMRHHSATHLLLYTLQKLYGKHIWQAGAKKSSEKARLDVTHYKKVSDEELKKIEKLVNKEVMANKQIGWFWMDRIEAEKKYGFRLYQGGVPPGKEIRIVQVGDDVQACGGTHCFYTGEIGMIKILKADSIQDGVVRFEFAAGEAAIEAVEKIEEILKDSSKILRVSTEALPKTVEKFFEEWKERGKELERLKEEIAALKAKSLVERAEEFDSEKVVVAVLSADMQELLKIGNELAKAKAIGCIVSKGEGKNIVVTFAHEPYDAREIILEIGRHAKGGGGGRKEIAQGAVEKLLSEEELATIIFEYLARRKS